MRGASGSSVRDWTLEKFYHHWFQSDSAILGLIDELGARDEMLFPRRSHAVWRPMLVGKFGGEYYGDIHLAWL